MHNSCLFIGNEASSNGQVRALAPTRRWTRRRRMVTLLHLTFVFTFHIVTFNGSMKMRMLLLLKKCILWIWLVAYALIGFNQRLQFTQYIDIASCDSKYSEDNQHDGKDSYNYSNTLYYTTSLKHSLVSSMALLISITTISLTYEKPTVQVSKM